MLKIVLTFGAEMWSIKQKHRNKLLAIEINYLSVQHRYYERIELELKQSEQKWE
jgi:hypothetical protein